MKKATVCMAALLVGLATVAASANVDYIDTFNGTYSGGPVGPIPDGWNFFGYGPPAYNAQETSNVLAPNDGTNSASKYGIPAGHEDSGFYALYEFGFDLDDYASEAIDWTQTVSLKLDVYGVDSSLGGKWKTELVYHNVVSQEWDMLSGPNDQWVTLSIDFTGGNPGASHIQMDIDFDTIGTAPAAGNYAIFENLRIEYTPVPEPASLGLMGLGLVLLRRRR